MIASSMQTLPEPYQSLFEAIIRDCGDEAIDKFKQSGADLNYCNPNTGRTPLSTATLAKRVKAVEALLKHGANPNQKFTYRSPMDGHVEADCVALHYASTAETAVALIRAGADVNSADASGTTPLMRAAFHGHAAVVSALLSAGASSLARQHERRGLKAHTARELAESKVEFWREAACENPEGSEQRRLHYEAICDILLAAERGIVAT